MTQATWRTTDGVIGVDLTHTTTSASATAGPPFALGTRVRGNNNSEWVFCYASGAIGLGFAVGLRPSCTATVLDTTGARAGQILGFAQVAFAAGDYGWIATRGIGLTVATTGAIAAGTVLYCSGTAGRLSSTAASTVAQISGVRLTTALTGTGASTTRANASDLVVVDPGFLI